MVTISAALHVTCSKPGRNEGPLKMPLTLNRISRLLKQTASKKWVLSHEPQARRGKGHQPVWAFVSWRKISQLEQLAGPPYRMRLKCRQDWPRAGGNKPWPGLLRCMHLFQLCSHFTTWNMDLGASLGPSQCGHIDYIFFFFLLLKF